jgi:hypothetical protein
MDICPNENLLNPSVPNILANKWFDAGDFVRSFLPEVVEVAFVTQGEAGAVGKGPVKASGHLVAPWGH